MNTPPGLGPYSGLPLGTRNGQESVAGRPPRGRRLDVVFGEPVLVPAQDWPRRRADVVGQGPRPATARP